jgi:DNA-binding beta-propeller fold protein YncE
MIAAQVQEQRLYSVPRQVFRRAARPVVRCMGAAAIVSVALSIAGCGNTYRPVVSAINPVGPSTQPTVYGTALSDPGNGQGGLITVFDVFGETTIANATMAPSPSYLGLDALGDAYVLHSNSVLVDSFASAPGLMTQTVKQSSLTADTGPSQVNPGSGSGPIYIIEPLVSKVAVLTGGAPPTIRQELPVPANPVYTMGIGAAPRVYTLSQGATPGTIPGTATAIENGANNVISASIPVGFSPVYGVMTADARRGFVINSLGTGGTNGTVSVINVAANNLDTTVNVGPNPLWADIAPAINELAVLNAGTSTTPGSLTVINIALCSQLALPGNVECDPNNPVDGANFGQVLGTVPVGNGPVQVAVLQDLSKAYVANAADGTVTVVDLKRMVATTTIKVGGHLNWIQAVAGNPTGKVFVSASDTQNLTVIRTDTDVVSTTIPLQGNAISVRIAQVQAQ